MVLFGIPALGYIKLCKTSSQIEVRLWKERWSWVFVLNKYDELRHGKLLEWHMVTTCIHYVSYQHPGPRKGQVVSKWKFEYKMEIMFLCHIFHLESRCLDSHEYDWKSGIIEPRTSSNCERLCKKRDSPKGYNNNSDNDNGDILTLLSNNYVLGIVLSALFELCHIVIF